MSGRNANPHLLLLLLFLNWLRKGQSWFLGTKFYPEISESLDNKEAVKQIIAVGSPLNGRGDNLDPLLISGFQ